MDIELSVKLTEAQFKKLTKLQIDTGADSIYEVILDCINAAPMSVIEDENLINEAINTVYSRIQKVDTKIGNSADSIDYIKGILGNGDNEVFGVVFLNSQNKITGHEELIKGTLIGCKFDYRGIIKSALEYNSSKVIFYHNAFPRGDDLEFQDGSDRFIDDDKHLADLVEPLNSVGVSILDHIVVFRGITYSSLADNNLSFFNTAPSGDGLAR